APQPPPSAPRPSHPLVLEPPSGQWDGEVSQQVRGHAGLPEKKADSGGHAVVRSVHGRGHQIRLLHALLLAAARHGALPLDLGPHPCDLSLLLFSTLLILLRRLDSRAAAADLGALHHPPLSSDADALSSSSVAASSARFEGGGGRSSSYSSPAPPASSNLRRRLVRDDLQRRPPKRGATRPRTSASARSGTSSHAASPGAAGSKVNEENWRRCICIPEVLPPLC
ncbi:unnamed protein product, partial [Urochloa humidicola]